MLESFLRQLSEEMQRLLRDQGPTVAFVKVRLSDGRQVTIWPDGRCTFLPADLRGEAGAERFN